MGVADLNWTGCSQVAPGLVTDTALACVRSSVGGASMWLFGRGEDKRIYANSTADDQNWGGRHEVPGGGLTDGAVSAASGPAEAGRRADQCRALRHDVLRYSRGGPTVSFRRWPRQRALSEHRKLAARAGLPGSGPRRFQCVSEFKLIP
jgi:hypothetical protein